MAGRVMAALALALGARVAAAEPPVLLGVLVGDGVTTMDLVFRREAGQWSELNGLTSTQARKTTLPAFHGCAERDDLPTATLAEFGHALFNAPTGLERWYGATPAGQPLQRRVLYAQQQKPGCRCSWGLRLDALAGTGSHAVVFANAPVDVRYFTSQDAARDLSDPRWEPATPQHQQAAIDDFLERDGADKHATVALQPWRSVSDQRLSLAGGEALVAVTARRSLWAADADKRRCTVPMMIATTLFRVDGSGVPRRLDSEVAVQHCDGDDEPTLARVPWALVRRTGETVLLQWQYGHGAARLALSRLDTRSLAPIGAPLSEGDESDC